MIKDLRLLWKTEKKKGIFKNKENERNKRIFRYGVITLHNCGKCRRWKKYFIGRLLYDSKAIFEDQMDILEETSKQRGEDGINLLSYRWTKIRKGARYYY